MDKSHDKVLLNFPLTPLLTHHFALSEKMVLTLAGGVVGGHKHHRNLENLSPTLPLTQHL